MFKNKLLNISIIIIISIVLLGVLAFVLYQYVFPGAQESNQEEDVIEYEKAIVSIPKISTNLGDSSVISIEMTFTLQTEDEDEALKEAEEKLYQIKDEINLFVKNYSKDSFFTEASINMFKKDLTLRINDILELGQVIYVDITQLYCQ